MNKIDSFFKDDDTSYFLFGPRGTGKTTWLNAVCGDGYRIDLLNAETRLSLMSNPQRLRSIVEGNLGKAVFVIDEIQKVPALLDVVHGLMEDYPEKRFVLTGSSARKLKREGVDLLGARALERHLHPFMAAELGADFMPAEKFMLALRPGECLVGRG